MPRVAVPEALPSPFDHNDLLQVEQMLQHLGVSEALIKRCQRCKIPVSEHDADCQALCEFYQSILAEFAGPQAPIGG